MKRLNYLPQAEKDLADIFDWIAAHDRAAAQRTVRKLVASAQRLSAFPESAPARPAIGLHIRSLIVGNYLVLHRVEEGRVDIVRVVHASRDTRDLLAD